MKPRIIITGAAGYVGRHLTEYMRDKGGFDLFLVDKIPMNDSDFLEVDLEYDSDTLRYPVDCVIDLAGISNVRDAYRRPYETFSHNLSCIMNTLAIEPNCYIFASSASVYQVDQDKGLYKENDPLGSNNSYGMSKIIGEKLLETKWKETGQKFAALRFSNIAGQFGGLKEIRPNETHLMPRLAYGNWTKKNPFPVYGRLDSERDYIHIEDVCSAILQTYEKLSGSPKYNGRYNVSTGDGTSIKQVLDEFDGRYENGLSFKCMESRPGDWVGSLVLDNQLFSKTFEWYPKYDLKEIVKSYVI